MVKHSRGKGSKHRKGSKRPSRSSSIKRLARAGPRETPNLLTAWFGVYVLETGIWGGVLGFGGWHMTCSRDYAILCGVVTVPLQTLRG